MRVEPAGALRPGGAAGWWGGLPVRPGEPMYSGWAAAAGLGGAPVLVGAPEA